MKKNKKVSIIGLWILIGLVGLYFGINYLKGLVIMGRTNTYYVEFKDVSSLALASPVMINGYKVGSVQNLNFQLDGDASTVVALNIKKKYKLSKDTKAVIQQGLLGGAEVVLIRENNGTPQNAFFQNGDTISCGTPYPNYRDMIDKDVVPTVKKILPKVDTITSVLKEFSDKLRSDGEVAQGANDIFVNVHEISENLNALIKNLRQFSEKDLPAFSSKMNKVADRALAISNSIDVAKLESIIDNLDKTSKALQALDSTKIENIATNLEKASNDLKEILSAINKGEGSLGKVVNNDELYERVNSIIVSADSLINEIKNNPKKYMKVKLTL